MRIIGLDPGLRHTGWGVIDMAGPGLSYVACGVVHSVGEALLAERLAQLFRAIQAVLERYRPGEAAVEETFVNRNPTSTLKLGQARGAVMLAPALAGLSVAEYAPNRIKKSVVGVGHASKAQVEHMVAVLLPGAEAVRRDAADALAVAICHAHYAAHRAALEVTVGAERSATRPGPRPPAIGAEERMRAAALARAVFDPTRS